MLRRLPLTARITLAIAVAVALSTAALAAAVLYAARGEFGRYLSVEVSSATAELRPLLEAHYDEHGGWQGVETLMRQQAARGPGMGRRARLGPGTIDLLLVDASGRVEFDPAGSSTGKTLPGRVTRAGVPLRVGGETVGYLVVQSGVQENAFYAEILNTLVWTGALATGLAIVMGMLLTRAAMRPLGELEAATGQISAGDLSVRVPVRARDEVGALAERFNRMASDLESQDRLRRRLMNDVAHELRTPLTVMRGQLEALQDGVFPLTVESLVPVHEQTLLLGRLVNDLRDLSLAEAGQIHLDLQPLDLAPVVQRVAARFAAQARTQGVDLEVTAAEGLPLVRGDAQRLEQVLNNLLSNALRHTPQGGHVALSLAQAPVGVTITVADSGEGIDPADLPHIFERFYRGDPARQRGDGRSGLGLAIARELVRAHGGDIAATSVLGQGTAIAVRLPAQAPGPGFTPSA